MTEPVVWESLRRTVEQIEKPVVISHKGCLDGTCAAFVALSRWPDAKVILQNPQEEPLYLECIDRDVIVLDTFLKTEQLVALRQAARRVVALDHHEDSEKAFSYNQSNEARKDFHFYYDKTRSGAGLALDAFFPGARAGRIGLPVSLSGGSVAHLAWLAILVEDRDLWKFHYGLTKPVCAFLDTLPKNPEAWKSLPSVSGMASLGEPVLAHQKEMVRRLAENAFEVKWPRFVYDFQGNPIPIIQKNDATPLIKVAASEPGYGPEWSDSHTLLVVNTPVMQSEVGALLYADLAPAPDHTVLTFYRGKDDWKCSLRSKPKVGADCNALAKRFGGGGHTHSAGFRVDVLEKALLGNPDPKVVQAHLVAKILGGQS